MANTRVSCTKGSWTKVVDNATGDVSIALSTDRTPVWLQATAADSAPSDDQGPLMLLQFGDGWSEATIEEKFPGVSSAAYLWAKPWVDDAIIGVSHA